MSVFRPISRSIDLSSYTAFRSSDRLIGTEPNPSRPITVPISGHTMTLERLVAGDSSRYRARIENPCLTTGAVTTCSEAAARTMEVTVDVPTGVSIQEACTGDYDGDGDLDIALRLSDDTCRVIEAVEDTGSTQTESPSVAPTVSEEPPTSPPPSRRAQNVSSSTAPSESPGSTPPSSPQGGPGMGAELGVVEPKSHDYERSQDYQEGI